MSCLVPVWSLLSKKLATLSLSPFVPFKVPSSSCSSLAPSRYFLLSPLRCKACACFVTCSLLVANFFHRCPFFFFQERACRWLACCCSRSIHHNARHHNILATTSEDLIYFRYFYRELCQPRLQPKNPGHVRFFSCCWWEKKRAKPAHFSADDSLSSLSVCLSFFVLFFF